MPSLTIDNTRIAGSAKLFEGVFLQLYPSMCMVANKLVKDKCLAEDIAQEAFVKFWSSNEQFDNLSSVKAYLSPWYVTYGRVS
jgi:RNA polymerase sigma-70 factor (ECF subfamily)